MNIGSSTTKHEQTKTFVFACFFFIGSILIYIFCTGLGDSLAIARSSQRTLGRVTRTEIDTSVTVNDEHPAVIYFVYEAAGEQHEGSSRTFESAIAARATPGTEVPIEYATSRPAAARITGTTLMRGGLLGAAFAFMFPILGLSGLIYPFFTQAARTRRALRGAPRVAIAQAKQGAVVKIVGRVRRLETALSAPLTQRPCAAYTLCIERHDSEGTSHICDDHQLVDFLIEDESGIARVRAADFTLALDRDERGDNPTEATIELLARRGGAAMDNLVFYEGVLEEGELASVCGFCSFETAPDPKAVSGYRDAPQRLVLCAPRGGKLLVSDDKQSAT